MGIQVIPTLVNLPMRKLVPKSRIGVLGTRPEGPSPVSEHRDSASPARAASHDGSGVYANNFRQHGRTDRIRWTWSRPSGIPLKFLPDLLGSGILQRVHRDGICVAPSSQSPFWAGVGMSNDVFCHPATDRPYSVQGFHRSMTAGAFRQLAVLLEIKADLH